MVRRNIRPCESTVGYGMVNRDIYSLKSQGSVGYFVLALRLKLQSNTFHPRSKRKVRFSVEIRKFFVLFI